MNFNMKHVPFSRYGSYLCISYLPETAYRSEGIYIRDIRGGDEDVGAIFKLDVTQNGKPVPFDAKLSATMLNLQTAEGFVKLILSDDTSIRMSGENVGLQLSLVAKVYDNAFMYKESSYLINVFSQKVKLMATSLKGNVRIDAPWDTKSSTRVIIDFVPDATSKRWEGMLETFQTIYQQKANLPYFEKSHNNVRAQFKKWLAKTLPVPQKYETGRELAAYITWSSVVKKAGYLPRPAMYMSKNHMTNIWSWDHCFNAMALHQHNPDVAWDQLMILFDVQDESGMLPDYMNNQFADWNCSKPPVHGWTLSWMMQRSEIPLTRIKEIYTPLQKWTTYFTRHCDIDRNGIPEYYHGNDSGWDNGTIFRKGIPVESPDLSTFLVLQMETLAQLAEKLGMEKEKQYWENASRTMLENMLTYFWNGEKFVAKHRGQIVEGGDSLLLFMPIILGKRLPKDIREKLIAGLKEKARFRTNYGLATESTSSPYYIGDGYWRGPIWAPSTMLLIDGLVSAGEEKFASELAHQFCDMANENGMAENFNAKTGTSLRDKAFTWTSSVFLILANQYIIKE